MLPSEDLERIAELKGISLSNTEKDYLQDLMLFSIYSITGKELVFKGGTCLYKIYKLDRFSEDLDFTLIKKINIQKLSEKIISNLNLLGIRAILKETKKFKNEINLRFLINGPLYNGSKETQSFIPLNISLREKTIMDPINESIIPLYKEIPTFDVIVMPETEILAEKIRAIFTREKARDIYDLWFLLKKRKTKLDISLINRKLALYNLKFDINLFTKRLDKMHGLWKIDLSNLLTNTITDYESVKLDILSEIRQMSNDS